MQSRPSKEMARRTRRALIYISIAFIYGICALGKAAIVDGEENRLKAERNQLSDTKISAQRGTIYDSNMEELAKSASAWLIYINPSKVSEDTQRELVVRGLCEIVGADEEDVRKKLEKTNTNYQKIAGEVETDVKDALKAYINENKDAKLSTIIGIDPDTKRYYPYSAFASTIIGFTDSDDKGVGGIEMQYDEVLTGVSGRVITAKNARQGAMASDYATTYDAQPGESLVLTIDEVIQYYLEQSLTQAMVDTGAKYAYGIIMDVDTGAVLGMSSKPDFDLNNPRRISNQALADTIAAIVDEKQRAQDTKNALYAQWRNRSISDTYEPGSVFKTIVAAGALEEGVVDLNTTFTCTGGIQVANNYQKCWKHGGHGHENLTQGLMNSCNPFFITIGQKLGKDNFYKYFDAFGFTEQTGIDLPAEAKPVAGRTYHTLDALGISELSSSSFGQTFTVSPIQMITAINTIANGGKLMQPYVVDAHLDADGNVVHKTVPTMKRQVVSEKTASTVAGMMEQVVSVGTGKNAYVAGYHVAGKTGTSEKIGPNGPTGEYIASFAGFAPADNPQISILIAIDEPVGEHGGGKVAAPIAGILLEKVLTYLNIEPQYEDDEISNISSVAPSLVGRTVSEAKNEAAKFTLRVIGNGDKVVAQTPAAGQQQRNGGVIVIYTDGETPKETAVVPNLCNLTIAEANRIAVSAGFNIRIAGNTNSGEVLSYKQSLEVGSEAEKGSVITVYFKSDVNVEDG